MDQNGSGVLIEKDKLFLSLGGRAEFFNDEKYALIENRLNLDNLCKAKLNVFLDFEECAFYLDVITCRH